MKYLKENHALINDIFESIETNNYLWLNILLKKTFFKDNSLIYIINKNNNTVHEYSQIGLENKTKYQVLDDQLFRIMNLMENLEKDGYLKSFSKDIENNRKSMILGNYKKFEVQKHNDNGDILIFDNIMYTYCDQAAPIYDLKTKDILYNVMELRKTDANYLIGISTKKFKVTDKSRTFINNNYKTENEIEIEKKEIYQKLKDIISLIVTFVPSIKKIMHCPHNMGY